MFQSTRAVHGAVWICALAFCGHLKPAIAQETEARDKYVVAAAKLGISTIKSIVSASDLPKATPPPDSSTTQRALYKSLNHYSAEKARMSGFDNFVTGSLESTTYALSGFALASKAGAPAAIIIELIGSATTEYVGANLSENTETASRQILDSFGQSALVDARLDPSSLEGASAYEVKRRLEDANLRTIVRNSFPTDQALQEFAQEIAIDALQNLTVEQFQQLERVGLQTINNSENIRRLKAFADRTVETLTQHEERLTDLEVAVGSLDRRVSELENSTSAIAGVLFSQGNADDRLRLVSSGTFDAQLCGELENCPEKTNLMEGLEEKAEVERAAAGVQSFLSDASDLAAIGELLGVDMQPLQEGIETASLVNDSILKLAGGDYLGAVAGIARSLSGMTDPAQARHEALSKQIEQGFTQINRRLDQIIRQQAEILTKLDNLSQDLADFESEVYSRFDRIDNELIHVTELLQDAYWRAYLTNCVLLEDASVQIAGTNQRNNFGLEVLGILNNSGRGFECASQIQGALASRNRPEFYREFLDARLVQADRDWYLEEDAEAITTQYTSSLEAYGQRVQMPAADILLAYGHRKGIKDENIFWILNTNYSSSHELERLLERSITIRPNCVEHDPRQLNAISPREKWDIEGGMWLLCSDGMPSPSLTRSLLVNVKSDRIAQHFHTWLMLGSPFMDLPQLRNVEPWNHPDNVAQIVQHVAMRSETLPQSDRERAAVDWRIQLDGVFANYSAPWSGLTAKAVLDTLLLEPADRHAPQNNIDTLKQNARALLRVRRGTAEPHNTILASNVVMLLLSEAYLRDCECTWDNETVLIQYTQALSFAQRQSADLGGSTIFPFVFLKSLFGFDLQFRSVISEGENDSTPLPTIQILLPDSGDLWVTMPDPFVLSDRTFVETHRRLALQRLRDELNELILNYRFFSELDDTEIQAVVHLMQRVVSTGDTAEPNSLGAFLERTER